MAILRISDSSADRVCSRPMPVLTKITTIRTTRFRLTGASIEITSDRKDRRDFDRLSVARRAVLETVVVIGFVAVFRELC